MTQLEKKQYYYYVLLKMYRSCIMNYINLDRNTLETNSTYIVTFYGKKT